MCLRRHVRKCAHLQQSHFVTRGDSGEERRGGRKEEERTGRKEERKKKREERRSVAES